MGLPSFDALKNMKKYKKPQQQQVGKFRTVISIDTEGKVIHLANMTIGDPVSFHHETEVCKTAAFDKEFFKRLTEILESYSSKYPTAANALVTVLVPDTLVATNVVSIPTLKKKQSDTSLGVVLEELYKNRNDLKINATPISTNKQYTSYALAMMRQDILTKIYSTFATFKMTPSIITYRANSVINAIESFDPHMAGETYLFLNIKLESATFSLVSRGRTAGYYSLPFGYKSLVKSRVNAENMMFDSPEAELLVINALEKARLKQLSVMQASENAAQTAQAIANGAEAEAADNAPATEPVEEEQYESELDNPTPAQMSTQTIKVAPKKMPLKLPKFMTRPTPNSEQEYIYENFRLFVKWALNLILYNKQNFVENVRTVYVNMPKEYDFLYEMVNAEKAENGVTFFPLELPDDLPEEILEDIELYGGFLESSINENNNF